MVANPYEPPRGSDGDEGQQDGYDQQGIGRECFAYFILVLALLVGLNTLMRSVRMLVEAYGNAEQ